MHRLFGAFAPLLVAGLLALPLPASAAGLDAAIDHAFELNKQSPEEAMDFLTRSLAAAEETKDEEPYLMAEGYFYLGRFHMQAEQWAEAEEPLARAARMIDSLGEAYQNDQLKIDAMELFAQAAGRQQRLSTAVDVFDTVLQIQARAKGRTHPDRLRTMQFMAITFETAESWRAAEYYWRTGLGVALDTGMSAEDVAYYREALAGNLDQQGRAEETERIRGGEAVADVEGAMLATIEVGERLRASEKHEEAHALYQKARADFAETAQDSILYMLVLKDVAETGDPEKHDQQAAIYEEAVAIQDRLFGLEPSASNGEFRYLAAREWAMHGDLPRAFKGFDDLDSMKGWVGTETGERQRAARSIMQAALRAPGADEACATPARTKSSFEILYLGYTIERVFAELGRNQGRAPALDCALALTAGSEVEETFRYATLSSLGLALIDTAQYERATSVFQEALASAEKAERPPGEIRLLLGGMALADAWTRRFDEGLTLVDRAEAIGGASDLERLTLLRIRSIILVNAVRYPEAEAVLGEALALIPGIPMPETFDNDLASSLNEFADILTRAGRTADALALIDRIPLPDTLPADASPAATIFYLDVRQSRMMYLVALDRREEAIAAAALFRDAAVPVVDRLLANPERNVILAGSIASAMTTGAAALASLDLNDDAATIAIKANALIAADQSAGVRLLAARNELVQAVAALIRGDAGAAMPGFDRALAAGQAILPDDSDEMLEIWLGRGLARLGLAKQDMGDPAEALGDLRQATKIAQVRIARETRFDDMGLQRKMRPSFESLVGSAWEAGNP